MVCKVGLDMCTGVRAWMVGERGLTSVCVGVLHEALLGLFGGGLGGFGWHWHGCGG